MLELQIGETMTITCQAVGVPTPQVVWRLNWGHIPDKCSYTSVNGLGTLTCPNIEVNHFISTKHGFFFVYNTWKYIFAAERSRCLFLWSDQQQRLRFCSPRHHINCDQWNIWKHLPWWIFQQVFSPFPKYFEICTITLVPFICFLICFIVKLVWHKNVYHVSASAQLLPAKVPTCLLIRYLHHWTLIVLSSVLKNVLENHYKLLMNR